MNPADRERLAAFYEEHLAKFGLSSKSLCWQSDRSQRNRFVVLAQIANLNGRSVLDVGCGLGDFYAFLKETLDSFRYTGYDISPKMVAAARKKHPQAKVEVRDILGPVPAQRFDYVFASGTFNIRVSDHERYVRDMIIRMYDLCREGVAFNLLHGREFLGEPEYYFADPGRVFEFCRSLCERVVLRTDYMPYDFTVYMYKSDFPREQRPAVAKEGRTRGKTFDMSGQDSVE